VSIFFRPPLPMWWCTLVLVWATAVAADPLALQVPIPKALPLSVLWSVEIAGLAEAPPRIFRLGPPELGPVRFLLAPFLRQELVLLTDQTIKVVYGFGDQAPEQCGKEALSAIDCHGECRIRSPIDQPVCLEFSAPGPTIDLRCLRHVAVDWPALALVAAACAAASLAALLAPLSGARAALAGCVAMMVTSRCLSLVVDGDTVWLPSLIGATAAWWMLSQPVDPEDPGALTFWELLTVALLAVWWVCGAGPLTLLLGGSLLWVGWRTRPFEAPDAPVGGCRVPPDQWEAYQRRAALNTRRALTGLREQLRDPNLRQRLSPAAQAKVDTFVATGRLDIPRDGREVPPLRDPE